MNASARPEKLGRYEVIRQLAQGGMAELFLARLPSIEGFAKCVVIKRVLPTLARDRQFVEMFLEEARLAATLHHQNVVHVHDIGQDDNGYFFAMEYLRGADIGEILRTSDTGIPLEIGLEIARGACAGLHYAHERRSPTGAPLGIVHRDISPQNLFVTFDGGVKLLDFGIAKAVQQISSHYTRSGTLRGKLPYMSPEQCQGHRIDRRSDVFSLAIVIWEMTVGERLFGGQGQSDFEILKSIVENDASAPSSKRHDYPPALEAIVTKGLRRDPAARFQSCDEMQAELEKLIRATGQWATARDVAAFMRDGFADRAAASMKIETQKGHQVGEIVPFPGVTREPPQTDVTVDLPKPHHVSVTPKSPMSAEAGTAPRETQAGGPVGATPLHVAATKPRTISIRAAMVIAIGAIAATAIVLFAMRRDHEQNPVAPVAPPTTSVSAAKPSEDVLWFQPDDYLVFDGPEMRSPAHGLMVAKMTSDPDQRGVAQFLTATGDAVSTKHFMKTHLARIEELVIGQVAYCRSGGGQAKAPAPQDKRTARTQPWITGKITDVSEVARGVVTVGAVECEVAGVRVLDP